MNIKNQISEIMSAWRFSKSLAGKFNCNRITAFSHLIIFNIRYRIRINDYQTLGLSNLDVKNRVKVAEKHYSVIQKKRVWAKEYYENRRFLAKWSDFKMGITPSLRHKRIEKYRKRYNMGKKCIVEYNVIIERHHFLFGTIKIGNNVLMSKNVYIDYTGHVEIEDGVQLTDGVIILSHHRDLDAADKGMDIEIQDDKKICEGTFIGSRAIIMPSCHYIGKYARIAAGAVVTKDVPDYTFMAGVPAKTIRKIHD